MPNRLPPPRDFNWARTLRTLSFWALLIVGAVALLQFAQNRRQEPDISYTQFTEQLEAANVDSVEITERQQIKCYLKRGVPSKTGRQYDQLDRKSTRLNSSHGYISYAVFCLKKKKKNRKTLEYNRKSYRTM